MSAEKTGETKSYRDPIGARAQAAALARKQYEDRFRDGRDFYDGFYFMFRSTDKRSSAFLAGSEGIVGSELTLVFNAGDVCIVARDGSTIARVNDEPAQRLRGHYDAGWTVRAVLSATFYHEAEKRFFAEVACFCYNHTADDEYRQALENFTNNIIYRINKGVHPALELSQEQFIRVIESKGAWYLTKSLPMPPREKGVVSYKRRRTWAEHLVVAATKGNPGCKVASVIFWCIFAAALVFCVWWFFIR